MSNRPFKFFKNVFSNYFCFQGVYPHSERSKNSPAMFRASIQAEIYRFLTFHTRAHEGPLVKVLRANGATYGKSVEYHGAILWNKLVPARRNAETLNIFKSQTKLLLKAKIPLVLM